MADMSQHISDDLIGYSAYERFEQAAKAHGIKYNVEENDRFYFTNSTRRMIIRPLPASSASTAK